MSERQQESAVLATFRVGEWVVSSEDGTLRSGERSVHLEPRVMALLVGLLERPGRVVSKSDLVSRVWPDTHVEASALARCISELRAALGDRGPDRRFIETVPKRGYRLLCPVEVAYPEPIAAQPEAGSVAILPMVDLSEGGDQGYFVDGLTEELIGALSQVNGLRVVARTSAFRFRNSNQDVREIGKALGVGRLLEGSVRKSRGILRISVQLIEAATGFQLWSQSYNRQLGEIFAIQEDISRCVVERMQLPSLQGRELAAKASVSNLEAYEHLMLARQQSRRYTRASFAAALESLAAAQRADPSASAPYSLEAILHGSMLMFYGDISRERVASGKAAARKALELNEQDAHAYAALGSFACAAGDWVEAERSFLKALELRPGALVVLNGWRLCLTAQGRSEEAVAVARRVVQQDPLNAYHRRGLATTLLHARRYEESLKQLERTLEVDAEHSLVRVLEATIYWQRDQKEEALRRLAKEPMLGSEWFKERDPLASIEAAIEVLEQLDDFPGRAFFVAVLAAFSEDDEQVLKSLEMAAERGDPAFWVNVKSWPTFDRLRSETRFCSLLERMNLLD